MKKIHKYIDEHKQGFIDGLVHLLKIPTISAQPEHKSDMESGVKALVDEFNSLGFKTEVWETPGHPVVFAETEVNTDKPTVLVYGHYDVQPPEPLELWTSPPFEPVIRDGYIYARGACDNKGQFYIYLKAVRALLDVAGDLPVNIKFIIEGEEEIGSVNLADVIKNKKERLKNDLFLVSDTSFLNKDTPAISCGLRGIVFLEVRIRGARMDCHSGMFGGAIANPAVVLSDLIASLHDSNGRITVDGFYDDVLPVPDEELELYKKLPVDEEALLKDLGVKRGYGEAGYSFLERRWVRPTLEVNGMTSGYTGDGAKTIIPAEASAKLSARLVPAQNPADVYDKIKDHLIKKCPDFVDINISQYEGAKAFQFDRNSPLIDKAKEALKHGFDRTAVLIREGGSIPIVVEFENTLNTPPLLIGFGLPDDRLHAPDERFSIDQFTKGILTICYLFKNICNCSDATKAPVCVRARTGRQRHKKKQETP